MAAVSLQELSDSSVIDGFKVILAQLSNMSIIQAIVEFLQAQGIDGTVTLGSVTFDYLSLVFGGIVGFILGVLFT